MAHKQRPTNGTMMTEARMTPATATTVAKGSRRLPFRFISLPLPSYDSAAAAFAFLPLPSPLGLPGCGCFHRTPRGHLCRHHVTFAYRPLSFLFTVCGCCRHLLLQAIRSYDFATHAPSPLLPDINVYLWLPSFINVAFVIAFALHDIATSQRR